MKLKIQPVRRMRKGKTKVWVACEASMAQAYEIRDAKGKFLRREQSASEAERIVGLFAGKPKTTTDRNSLVRRRWNDVKDRIL